jgi:hypothetical protein
MEEFLNRCPKRNLLRWFLDLTVLLFLQGDLIKSGCYKSSKWNLNRTFSFFGVLKHKCKSNGVILEGKRICVTYKQVLGKQVTTMVELRDILKLLRRKDHFKNLNQQELMIQVKRRYFKNFVMTRLDKKSV